MNFFVRGVRFGDTIDGHSLVLTNLINQILKGELRFNSNPINQYQPGVRFGNTIDGHSLVVPNSITKINLIFIFLNLIFMFLFTFWRLETGDWSTQGTLTLLHFF